MTKARSISLEDKEKDTKEYCEGCIDCQKNKGNTGKALNDPTSLELPERRWGLVSADFIVGLPKTGGKCDAIATWMDRQFWRVDFIPSKSEDSAVQTAKRLF